MVEWRSRFTHAPVAQGIERWVADPKAVGSNPTRRTPRCRTNSIAICSSWIGTSRTLWAPGPVDSVCYTLRRRDVRVVEGAALEKRCSDELPWVRIPLSPPAVRVTATAAFMEGSHSLA